MATKILGHRIGEKVIEEKHIADGVKFKEGQKVQLNFPTHSNENDLTTTQRQILTQGGNADALHYHTGGGGGPEGIYTHSQIDSALLRIMMELNAQKYGLQHSIIDRFDDDSGIYRGIQRPSIANVSEVISVSNAATLQASKSYYYKIAVRWQGNYTDASSPAKLNTSDTATAPYRQGKIQAILPFGNQGVRIWRALGDYMNQEVFIDSSATLYSPESMNYEVMPAYEAKTETGKPALRIDYNGVTSDTQKDILLSTYGGVVIGEAINTIIYPSDEKPVIKFGYKNSTQMYPVSQIYLLWDTNPAYIPLEYTMEYTTIPNPDINNDAHWQPFSGITLVVDDGSSVLSTDGTLIGSSVINNTKYQNKFRFPTIKNLTGVRVRVTKMVAAVKLTQLSLYYMGVSNGFKVIHSLDQSKVDLTGMNTMMVDVKADVNHDKFLMGIVDANYVSAVTGAVSIYNTSNTNWSTGANASRVVRCRTYVGSVNRLGYNKIRLKFRPQSNNIKLSNVTVALDTGSGPSISMPQTIRQVTFNNGSPTYEGNPGTYLYSDWISLDFPNATFTYVILSFVLEAGTLYAYGADGNMYVWYNDSGIISSWDTTGGNYVGWQGSYTFIHQIEVAKGYDQKSLKPLPQGWDKWFTQYIDISASSANITNLKELTFKMNGVDQNGSVYFSNIRFSTVQELLKTGKLAAATASTVGAGSVAGTTDSSLTSYWQSTNVPTVLAPEMIMYKLNAQYLIEKVRLLENDANADYTLEKYSIQYTIDNTAVVTDPIDSPKWLNVDNLRISNALTAGFTGVIVGNTVNEGNLHKTYVDHVFSPVQALAIRLVIWKTINNTTTRLYDIELYTVEDSAQYQLIADITTPQDENFEWMDDGHDGVVDSPLSLNTTGSYNIYYDSANDLIRVFDKRSPGIFVSDVVDTELFMHFLVSVQSVDTNGIQYFVSGDDGSTWTPVTLEVVNAIPTPGSKFKIMAVLRGDDVLSAYSVLYTL